MQNQKMTLHGCNKPNRLASFNRFDSDLRPLSEQVTLAGAGKRNMRQSRIRNCLRSTSWVWSLALHELSHAGFLLKQNSHAWSVNPDFLRLRFSFLSSLERFLHFYPGPKTTGLQVLMAYFSIFVQNNHIPSLNIPSVHTGSYEILQLTSTVTGFDYSKGIPGRCLVR